MSFLNQLWHKVTPAYQSILNHQFNAELASGLLPRDRFVFYLKQSRLLITEFLQALYLVLAKTNPSTEVAVMLRAAEGILNQESDFYERVLQLTSNEDGAARVSSSPACTSYANFLIANAAIGDVPIALSAIIPHFLLHYFIALSITTNQQYAGNPYLQWVENYSDLSFASFIQKSWELVDRLAVEQAPITLQRMEEIFFHSILLKWHFFEDIYSLKGANAC